MSDPKVAAIVLNFNGREVTLQTLASLERIDYPSVDLLVVDNGSSDGSYEAVAAQHPGVAQVRTEQNLGAAGGVNLGIRWAMERDYDYLLVLNNDIEVHPKTLRELTRGNQRAAVSKLRGVLEGLWVPMTAPPALERVGAR